MTASPEVRKARKEKFKKRQYSLIPKDIRENYNLSEIALTSTRLERAQYRSNIIEIEYIKEKLNIDVTKLYSLNPYPGHPSEQDIVLNLLRQELFLYKLNKLRKKPNE